MLRGLWLSGLRLSEALALHWVDDSELCIDLSGRRPMFRIDADAEKGGKDRILPMTLDFAALLDSVPESDRDGYVFNPAGRYASCRRVGMQQASKTFSAMGNAASVRVSDKNGRLKYASAHDLRRAFGFRWSRVLMPADLQTLMRHENIQTTMTYYVGQNTEATADAVWKAAESSPEVISSVVFGVVPDSASEGDSGRVA